MTAAAAPPPQLQGDDLLQQSQQHLDNLPSTTGDVYNWSHVYKLASQSQVCRPHSNEEIVSLIQSLRADQFIRVIGSGLSFEQIHSVIESEGSNSSNAILLDLRHLTGLMHYDTETHRVTYRAGTVLEAMFLEMQNKYNRILPCSPGVIAIQTLAGAISTGTHGQGLYQSSLADVVHSLTLIDATGNTIVIDSQHKHFGAYITSLGSLGVIVDVTLNTTAARVFTCEKTTITFDEMIDTFVDINRNNEFAKGWWFPDSDQVHVWSVNESNESDAEQWRASGRQEAITITNSSSSNSNSITEANLRHAAMIASVDAAKLKMGSEIDNVEHSSSSSNSSSSSDSSNSIATTTTTPTSSPLHYRTVDRFKNSSTVTGSMYQLLCKGIPIPQINCEICVPLTALAATLTALQHWYNSTDASLHYPFILRCTGPSAAWLNGSYQQDCCWIGSLVYLKADGTAVAGGMQWLQQIQAICATTPHNGIPHLGKHYRQELYRFSELLPRFSEFSALRLEVDPEGKFSNKFVKQLFEVQQQHKQQYVEPASLTKQLQLQQHNNDNNNNNSSDDDSSSSRSGFGKSLSSLSMASTDSDSDSSNINDDISSASASDAGYSSDSSSEHEDSDTTATVAVTNGMSLAFIASSAANTAAAAAIVVR